jgi:hypothetical protein
MVFLNFTQDSDLIYILVFAHLTASSTLAGSSEFCIMIHIQHCFNIMCWLALPFHDWPYFNLMYSNKSTFLQNASVETILLR